MARTGMRASELPPIDARVAGSQLPAFIEHHPGTIDATRHNPTGARRYCHRFDLRFEPPTGARRA